ncbi:YdcF family protein [Eggerthellaceae bacterium zg-1084]|uniref:SanA/YdcF family protein n=1 Tax=Berryella wangjianweii TaxID=2734634 RepID=UPI001557DB5C|nr:YdcF family protein [Berryella wangjianweii]NPD30731.1 YdcF family protein [Berryella wangjianweii]
MLRAAVKAVVGMILAAALLALVTLGVSNAYVLGSTAGSIIPLQDAAKTPKADAIVVLGASVYVDGTPSDVLRDRLDCAARLYHAGVAPLVVVTGDGHTQENDEPAAMRAYLMAKGVPDEAIIEDGRGYSTYDSIARLQENSTITRVVMVTQRYHLPRALCSAHLLGYSAQGVACDTGTYDDQPLYELREVPARTKDLVKAALHAESQNRPHADGPLGMIDPL